MTETIENPVKNRHVRFEVQANTHDRAHRVKRQLAIQKNQDITVINIYLKAIEIGLEKLETELGMKAA